VGLSETDLNDVKLSRPVAVVDLWDIDDRISRLEDVACRLEKIVEVFLALYGEERVKSWELILKEMLKKYEQRRDQYDRNRRCKT